MPGLEKGIALFNEGDFFEAHAAWEKEWRNVEESPEKHFLKGLIMLAAAFHHSKRGEYTGALKLLERGMELIKRNKGANWDIEDDRLVREAGLVCERIRSGQAVPDTDLPKIHARSRP